MKSIFALLSLIATFFILDLSYSSHFNGDIIGLSQEILILCMSIFLILFIKNVKVKLFLSLILFSTYYLIFAAQVVSIKITGDMLNIAAIANAGQFMLLLNATTLLYIIIFIVIFIILVKLITILIKNTNYLSNILILSILLVTYIWVLHFKHAQGKIQTFMPAKSLYEVVNLFYNLKQKEVTHLSKDDISIVKKFNIDIKPNKVKPFEKEYLYKDNLPFNRVNNQKPNVIIFFVESLSARLLSPYNLKMKEVTPNIDNFANVSMVVKGYYNHATPTAPGLYGQNCSLYPLLTYHDFNKEVNQLKQLNFKCLASYFDNEDYETSYLTHSRSVYSHIKENLKLWGYKNVYAWKNLLKEFLPSEKELVLGETGLSDHQMMRAVVSYLKKYSEKKPFFMGISTIESHVGFEPNSVDGIKYKEGTSNTLNMIHNLDDSFGIFWRYFKKSKYYKNTIVILTGDHSLYPNEDFKKVAGKDWIASVYDRLSLIIYDPIHKLPSSFTTNSTSVDLAPTVVHLANLPKKQKNSFLGKSIFEAKEYNNSFGISAYPDFNFYINNNNKITNMKLKYIEDKRVLKEYNILRKMMEYTLYLQNRNKF